jgi:flagellar hook-associated protein 1 FlgK
MSSLFSIGTSGLTAAQLGLKTVGNNIANAGTDGYSRQSIVQVDRLGQSNSRYTIGSGVDVVAVQRAYSQYLTTALWSGNSSLQGATTYNDLATTLNGLLKNSGDLQGALDDFYAGFSDVANAPSDKGSRQALLGDAAAVSMVFNTLGSQLDQQRGQINTQIASTVDGINTTVKQIAALNLKISQAGGTSPNDLLDQRDSLVKQLAGYIGITTASQPDGTLSVYASSGQVLVSGGYSYGFQAGTDPYDASRTVVLDPNGNDISARLSGGTLGALLDYRSNVLDPAQNKLGQAAIALAGSVNAQQARGLDLDGNQGGAIFGVPAPQVGAASGNAGNATVGAAISDIGALTGADYVLSYTGSTTAPSANGWTLSTTGGQSVALTANPDGTLSADGLTLTVSGTAQVGDSYQIRPTRGAAGGLAVTMTDPSGIAAAAALKAGAASGNAGSAAVAAVGVQDGGDADLFAGATIAFTSATDYTITDGAGNTVSGTYASGTPIVFDGWSLTLTGTPAAGDGFTVGRNSDGLNDNSNALDLAALADQGVLDGGKTSVVRAYADLTNQIGTAGSIASSNLATQTSLYDQAAGAQQSAAGVNLDEEAASLIKYQQAYQASAQVIATAQTLFASLITAIQG